MPAPLAPRRLYIWPLVNIRYAGIFTACNSAAIARDAEDAIVQTADVHGTSMHYYVSNTDATVNLEIPLNQKVAIDLFGGIANAMDVARQAGGNPGAVNPPVPFFIIEPASGSKFSCLYARVAGQPSGITMNETGIEMVTFKILCPQSTLSLRGYQAAV